MQSVDRISNSTNADTNANVLGSQEDTDFGFTETFTYNVL
jgi:hypothetical protein